jgi:CubicO group peptidase (beta-lactamase class C family)
MTRHRPMCRALRIRNTARRRSATCCICPPAYFGETKDGQRDLNRLWIDMVLGLGPTKGTISSIVQFNRRIAAPGTKYFYARIEADVLGVVLHYAVSQSASDYLREKLWEPIGAEADAAWVVDAQGFEVAHGFFNAVLRDYAWLGRLLAHDGVWEGRQIIPAQYMIDATATRPSDGCLAPGKATPTFGYGYFLWLLPGDRRQFELVGDNGQRICVDPTSKLIMVQTAVENTDEVWHHRRHRSSSSAKDNAVWCAQQRHMSKDLQRWLHGLPR